MNLNLKIKISQNIIQSITDENFDKKLFIAWTSGKDSIVLVDLFNRALGYKVDLFFIDSGFEFEETKKTYRLMEENGHRIYSELARLEDESDKNRKCPCQTGKIEAIKRFVNRQENIVLALGIRWDEAEARKDVKYVNHFIKNELKGFKEHWRLHPILHWSENEIWQYIRKYNLPVNPLYKQGYRSLGCKHCTVKAVEGGDERSGRDTEKENVLKQLQDRGYCGASK